MLLYVKEQVTIQGGQTINILNYKFEFWPTLARGNLPSTGILVSVKRATKYTGIPRYNKYSCNMVFPIKHSQL